MKKENRKITNETPQNISKIDPFEMACVEMYNKIQTIQKQYSEGLIYSCAGDYMAAISNICHSYIPEDSNILTRNTSPIEKLKYIDEKLKVMSEIVSHKLRESLLLIQPQIDNQYVMQQFHKIMKVLDDIDASSLERLPKAIEKSVHLNKDNEDSKPLYKYIDESYKVVAKVALPAHLTELIADIKDEINSLDKYFIKINNYIGVIKQSKDPNAIKALSMLIKSIEKYLENKNLIQELNVVTSILNQQNLSLEDAEKLSKTITYLEQNIKNQNSVALDDVIALLNAHKNKIQLDFKNQNMMKKKSTIKSIINQCGDLLNKNKEQTTQEHKKLTSVASSTNKITPRVRPTSSLDHRFGEDQKSVKQACINFQNTIRPHSEPLMQNSSKLSQFTSRKVSQAAKPKNNTEILYTDL